MRPRYSSEAIVLARTPLAEASALFYLLTHEFGLVKARAQGIRKPGAKLAAALQTFTESDVILVRGKEGWRLSGAVLATNWFETLPPASRSRAGRIASLLLRFVHGESGDPALFYIFRGLLEALPALSEPEADAAECLAALRLLRALGLDEGTMPGEGENYTTEVLAPVLEDRRSFVTRINRGIEASGL
jgi:DNA repair protein RecO